MHQKFDIIIVGAGPAGCACAIQLAKSHAQLQIALLDKHTFPRDKICGDALSPDVINQVKILSDDLAAQLQQSINAHPINGIKIAGRKKNDFAYYFRPKSGLVMYTCARLHLDALLFEHTKQFANIHFVGNCDIKDIDVQQQSVWVHTDSDSFEGEMVIGADGAHSVVARKLGRVEMDKHYHAGALRVYYEGITGLEEGLIELHFVPEVLPGYLWIFPLPNQQANVGLGMLSQQIADDKINLRQKLQYILENNVVLKERFANAKALENVKGFGLPFGGKKNKISGERFLLLGDAASLIDPFTGEGIGNALRSGRIAAEHITNCLKNKDFSEKTNQLYDKEVYRRMMPEFRVNYLIRQMLYYFPISIDIFVGISSKIKGLDTFLMDFSFWFNKVIAKSR